MRRSIQPRRAPCPCGLDAVYAECCGRFHQGRATAATATQLMRSRYSAFVLRDAAYLMRTWSARNRPPGLEFDDHLRWTGLEILKSTGGTALHTEGTVEFRATYVLDRTPGEHHESSTFIRESGEWMYVSGTSGRGS